MNYEIWKIDNLVILLSDSQHSIRCYLYRCNITSSAVAAVVTATATRATDSQQEGRVGNSSNSSAFIHSFITINVLYIIIFPKQSIVYNIFICYYYIEMMYIYVTAALHII